MKRINLLIVALISSGILMAQEKEWQGKFEQLGTMLPTPNTYRTASGAPGHEYWQQRADYEMQITLDDANQSISGEETITYFNQSPDKLNYLWMQLDQNLRARDTNSLKVSTNSLRDSLPAKFLESQLGAFDYDGGFKIKSVKDSRGNDLSHTINKTMMRIDLPKVLNPGEQFSFRISWSYNINDRMLLGGRSGLEFFPEDDNYLYAIAQFFPRMAVYDDVEGWQNKQFLGSGEFALPFGNYKVSLTVPADHIVTATGVLQNPGQVLTKTQQDRFEQAKKSFDKPVFIVTEKEAISNEKSRARNTKTWVFHAENVRDFAFASSRKFIWDAMAVKVGDKAPLAMSLYPKEGNPLWEEESTIAVKNTLDIYSKYTFDYPYPVAISVHTAAIGMEYPMICFNFGRPNPDGSYHDRTKYGMIGVIIHEVGHNYFPMIVNADERQWTWMDEGLNSFLQYLTEQERYTNFPSRRGPPKNIVNYMKGDKSFIRPIMTNSEQVMQLGNNAYGKPATALNILRETVMGRELFDMAFKEYAQRWMFKHPTPADFFRTMEDASAVDLDWFWKGWFYTVDHVDLAIDEVKWYRIKEESLEPESKRRARNRRAAAVGTTQKEGKARDFSAGYQELTVLDTDERFYREFRNRVDDDAIREKLKGMNFYEITFTNEGGLVMPIILEFQFADGTKEEVRIPAEIWRYNENKVTKVFMHDKEVEKIILDPHQETADVEVQNNFFPFVEVPSRFEEFRDGR